MTGAEKAGLAATARGLAWFTLCYNLIEAAVCAFFGIQDGSEALLGFGGDSLIEAASAGVILWRFRHVALGEGGESLAELSARKLISTLLIALALYLSLSAWFEWREGSAPVSGLPGTVISLVSLGIMGWLYARKKACARALKSRALEADAFCTLSCMWLSAILLLGSALYALTGLAWLDPAATLVMAFFIAREGAEEYEESDEERSRLAQKP